MGFTYLGTSSVYASSDRESIQNHSHTGGTREGLRIDYDDIDGNILDITMFVYISDLGKIDVSNKSEVGSDKLKLTFKTSSFCDRVALLKSSDIKGFTTTQAGTWDGGVPTNLDRVTDDDSTTSQTAGETEQTAINLAYMQIDMGSSRTGHLATYWQNKITISGTASTAIQHSLNGSSWTTLTTKTTTSSPYVERSHISEEITARYIRCSCWHSTGGGAAAFIQAFTAGFYETAKNNIAIQTSTVVPDTWYQVKSTSTSSTATPVRVYVESKVGGTMKYDITNFIDL